MARAASIYSLESKTLATACRSELKKAWKIFKHDLDTTFGWTQKEDVCGIQVFGHMFNPKLIKRTGVINASPEEIIKFIQDPKNWRKWNEVCLDCHYLRQLGDINILYYKLGLTWPTPDRELILAQGVKHLSGGGLAYVLRSIDDEAEPTETRAFAHFAVIQAIPNSMYPEKSDVTYMTEISLGTVPKAVEDEAQAKRHRALLHIKEFLAK